MKRIIYTLMLMGLMMPFYATAQTYTIVAPKSPLYTFCVGSYLELPALPTFNTTPIAYTWMISSGTSSLSSFLPFQNRLMTSNDNNHYIQLKVIEADSTITYSNKLKIYSRTSSSEDKIVTSCDSYTWHGVTYMASTNVPTFDTVNANGCQHTVHLHLTIKHSTNSTTLVDTCNSFTWYGTTYHNSINTTHYGLNYDNCPDTHNLKLTIHHNNINGNDYANVCDNYTWHGSTYTSSGNYPYNTQTVHGCDSVCTLHLTIRNSTSGTDVHSVCDSYTWIDGNTYTSNNNTAQYVIYNSQHCDSTVTLNLTVFHSDTNAAVSANVCDTYDWNGHTYTTTGVYPYTTTTVQGCDSLCKLYLTVRKSTSHNDFVTECHQYTWMNNVTYYSDTNTQHTILNTQGCDSVNTLFLTIIPNERPPVRELIVKNLGTDSPKMVLYPRNANETDYTYQWFKDSIAIVGATKQYYMLKGEDGGSHTFSVYVTPLEQVLCGSNSSKEITLIGDHKSIFMVTPNPNYGDFVISFSSSEEQIREVIIYSQTGSKVYYSAMQDNVAHINEQLPSGVYNLFVKTDKGNTHTQKIIIK